MKNKLLKISKKSLFFKNYIKISCFILVAVFFVSSFLLSLSNSYTKSEFERESQNSATAFAAQTENLFHQMQTICNYLASHELVSSYISTDNPNQIFDRFPERLTSLISQFPVIYDFIDSIYVYSELNNDIFTKDGSHPVTSFSDTLWMPVYDNLKSSQENSFVYPRKMYGNYPYVLSFIRFVKIDEVHHGAIILNLNIKKIKSSDNDDINQYYIINENNKIVYSDNMSGFLDDASSDNFLNEFLKRGLPVFSSTEFSPAPYSAAIVNMGDMGYSYIVVNDLTTYSQKINLTRTLVLGFCFVFILLGLLYSYFISKDIYMPIKQLTDLVDKSEKEIVVDEQSGSEINYIAQKIVETMSTNDELNKQIQTNLEQISQLRLYSLHCQINPHFIFNTLNVINLTLVKKFGIDDPCIDIIDNLSKLIRYSLDFEHETVSIKKELSYTKKYIEILNTRKNDVFNVDIDIPDELNNSKIPQLCFQPIIENSIFHGFANITNTEKNISIKGELKDSVIVFTICDNGAGIDEKTLLEIRNRLESDNYLENSHIGLCNVHNRIRLIFGNEYGLAIDSVLGKGTTVTVTLPFIID